MKRIISLILTIIMLLSMFPVSVLAAEPPVEPTEPPVVPTEPPVEPTEPPVVSTQPPVVPTEPPVVPTDPPVVPTEPPVVPTEPPVVPTEPPVVPTEPPVVPTEPPVEPTEPPVVPTEPPVEPLSIFEWGWYDPDEFLVDGELALPGASERNVADYETVLSMLPSAIDCEHGQIAVTWQCADYPAEGAWEGEYSFIAQLPEGYVMAEGAAPLTVKVILGGGFYFDEPATGIPVYLFLAEPGSNPSPTSNNYEDHPKYTQGSGYSMPKANDIGVDGDRNITSEQALSYIDWGTMPLSPAELQNFGTVRFGTRSYTSDEYEIIWYSVSKKAGTGGGEYKCYCSLQKDHLHMDGILQKKVSPAALNLTKRIDKAQSATETFTFTLKKLQQRTITSGWTERVEPLDPADNGYDNNFGSIQMTASIAPGATEAPITSASGNIVPFGFYEVKENLNDNPKWDATSVEITNGNRITTTDSPAIYLSVAADGTLKFSSTATGSYSTASKITLCNVIQKYTVKYDWGTEAPNGVILPSGQSDLAYGDSYTVDSTYTKGYTVDGTNAEGKHGKWVFSGWDQTGTIIILDEPIIKGQWVFEDEHYTITYTDGVELATPIFPDQVYEAHIWADGSFETVPPFTGDEPVRSGFEFMGWLYIGENDQHKGNIYTTAEAAMLDASENIVFAAQWKPLYTGTVRLIPDNSTVSTLTAAQIFGSGSAIWLRPTGSTAEDAFIPMTESLENGNTVYTSVLEQGSYDIFYSGPDGVKQQYLAPAGNTRNLTISPALSENYHNINYYSVTYNLNGGALPVTLPQQYYIVGSNVPVTSEAPTQTGYVFTGWAYESNAASPVFPAENSTADRSVITYLDKPTTLYAQWHKETWAKVHLVLEIETAGANYTDASPDGSINTVLAYRELGTETYYEYNPVQKTIDNWYTAPASGTVVKREYKDWFGVDPALSADYDYSVNVSLHSYEVIDRTVSERALGEDGFYHYTVTVKLKYNPDLFHLEYKAVADEALMQRPERIPSAVDLKISVWNPVEDQWQYIQAHQGYNSTDIEITDGSGSGSYHVPRGDHDTTYHFRVEVMGFTVGGTELGATGNGDKINYASTAVGNYGAGQYTAEVTVTGGGNPEPGVSSLEGAYSTDGSAQTGQILVTISYHPYNVVFRDNDDAEGEQIEALTDVLKIPNINDAKFQPTRSGYRFAGWFYDEEFTKPAVSNAVITADMVEADDAGNFNVHLYAKWLSNITVCGEVRVPSDFSHYEHDRLQSVTVTLHRTTGTNPDVNAVTVPVAYGEDGIGVASYSFADLPDLSLHGSNYRINVLATNFESLFQNEGDSIDEELKKDPAKYNASDFFAEDTNSDGVYTINSYLSFVPENFELNYEVDSTAVGENYRDITAVILVTCDDGLGRTVPSQWDVISQMLNGNGAVHLLSEGKAHGTYPVWKGHTDGNMYSYGIKFAEYSLPGAEERTEFTSDDDYISVSYDDPAQYRAEPLNGLHQTQLLRAIITPKSYPVVYNLGSGSGEIITGMGDTRFKDGVYEGVHTWSYETTLPVPVRAGYEFLGWYDNQDFTGEKLSSIAASVTYTDDVSKTIPLYARWLPCQDTVDVKVTLIHRGTDGVSVAQNYGRNMQIVLTASDETLTPPEYIPVEGQRRIDILGNVWHDGDRTDEMDEFRYFSHYGYNPFTGLPSDKLYSANVYMEHYTVTNRQVTATAVEVNGQTTDSTHYLVELTLQFNPDDFFFTFQTEMEKDTEGRVIAPEALWPRSAEFKVTCWYTFDENPARWQAITQHENSVVKVRLNADGSGQGGYSVWNHEAGTTPYYYRMELVSLTLKDGTVLPMSGSDHVTYTGQNYSAVIEADGNCLAPSSGTDLKGAYAARIEDSESYAQAGALKAIISVDTYNVTLNANGGKLMVDGQEQDSYTYSQQVRMPDISGHVPVKTGHSFAGWTLPNASVPAAGTWLTGSLVLNANYTPKSYPINYHTDGGSVPTEPLSYTYDAANPFSIADAQTSKTDYVFMGWYDNADFSGAPVTEIPAGSTGAKDFYALWEEDELGGSDGIPDKYQILVRYVAAENGYVLDGEGGNAVPSFEKLITLEDENKNYLQTKKVTVDGAAAQADKGYAFDRWTWDDTISSLSFEEGKNAQSNPSGALSFDAVGGSTYIICANFDTDEKGDTVPDGIPDKYQILIEYKVENGTWVSTAKLRSFYLEKVDAKGEYSQTGVAYLTSDMIPVSNIDMRADDGYKDIGGWSGYEPNTIRPLTADSSYLYVFDAQFHNVSYPDVDKPTGENNVPGTGIISVQKDRYIRVDPNGGTLDGSDKVIDIKIESDLTLAAPTRQNHVFIGYKRTEGTGLEADGRYIAQTFTAQWLEDNNGDRIPDKYQAKVEYRSAGNGTVSPEYELYTFVDENGKWTEGGTLIADGSTATPVAPTVDRIFCFDYWSNDYSASFDESSAATGSFTIPNAKGGSTYSFTAHFAVDVLYDGGEAENDSGAYDHEHKGDNIPDYKQFVIYYRPFDDSHGNVGYAAPGTNHVAEVFTLTEKTEDVTPRVVNTFPNPGYAFDYWAVASKPDNPIWPFVEQPAEQGGSRTYRAHFAEDANGDNIPDKYQTKITYVIEGGSWTANTADTANKEKWYTLYERDSETNLWVKLENVTLGDRIPDISLAEPDANQHLAKPGHWDVTPAADTPVTGTATYTYTFSDLIKHSITVTVTNGSFDADDNPATVEESPLYVEHGKNISLSFTPDTGYALQALKVDGQDLNASAYSNNLTYSFNNVDENHSIEVVYSVDKWKDEGDLEEGGDGIADSRQVKFSFVSENEAKGTVTGATVQVITLSEGDNTAAPESVTVTAQDGWKFDKWLDEENSETSPFEKRAVNGGDEYLFTATFAEVKATVSYPDADKDEDKNNKPDDGEAEVQKTLYIEVRPNGGTWKGSSIDQLVLVMGDMDLSPDPVKVDCAFEGWNRTDGRTTDDGKTIAYVFTAKWSSDLWSDEKDGPGSDGIPDRFQIKVNYSPVPEEFGQVSSQCEVHTLTDGNGGYLSSGTVQLEGSTATAIEIADPKDGKNSFVNWTDTVKKPAGDETIVPVGDEAQLKLTVQAEGGKEYNYYANFRHEMLPAAMYLTEYYLYSDTAKAYVLDEDETVVAFGTVGEKVSAQIKNIDGYALNESLSVTEGIVTMPESNAKTRAVEGFLTLRLYYDIDAGGPGGSQPDGVPDIYQKKITFSVINGIWGNGLGSEPITVWVTLYDEQGNPSPLGKGTLTAPTGMRPFHGYGGGYWDKIPPTVVYGTNSESYTFWFTRLFVPITGDESGLGLWCAIAVMSLVSTSTIAFRLRRKKTD